MAITQAQVDLLNRYAVGAISGKVPLGTLIQEAGNIEASDIQDGAVTAAKLASDAVTTAKILDGNVTTAKIGALQVTTAKLAADAVDGTKLADAAVSLEHLDSGIAPSHVVKFAGKHTTVADGGGLNVVAVPGVLATDIVIACIQTVGAVAVLLRGSLPATDQITFNFNGDPDTDHIVAYTVLRAAS